MYIFLDDSPFPPQISFSDVTERHLSDVYFKTGTSSLLKLFQGWGEGDKEE
jgi:hypothetical protein